MPSVSKKQHSAAGLAYAAKKGEISPKQLKGAARQMYASMSSDQLRDFASTKTSSLPERVKKRK